MKTHKNAILIHYDEIGLKGNNRRFFEDRLIANIQDKIQAVGLHGTVRRLYGRLWIDGAGEIHIDTGALWYAILSTTPGIANFSFAYATRPMMDAIKEAAKATMAEAAGTTFRITARRDATCTYRSHDIAVAVGAHIADALGKTVDLTHPDATCFVEVVDGRAFVYAEKKSGVGGLPVGVSGKAVLLLSGGIDSPVAAWYAMKRGLAPIFVHFHAYPFTNNQSVEKVRELARILCQYHEGPLLLVPFGEIQKYILLHAPDTYRILLYRRYMMRIAEHIAAEYGAQTMVTGESLGQVASQTIENIAVTESATTLPVLRPLIGFDKKEIIDKAKHIGTLAISNLPHQDCCTLFTPKQPKTHGTKEAAERIEAGVIGIEQMVEAALQNREIIDARAQRDERVPAQVQEK